MQSITAINLHRNRIHLDYKNEISFRRFSISISDSLELEKMLKLIIPLIVCGLVPESSAHDRPVIGVLVQEISKVFEMMYPNRYSSFIAASYVKWVESGGARVVPVWIGRDKEYYQEIMSKTNGILLPGGNVDKHTKGGYGRIDCRDLGEVCECRHSFMNFQQFSNSRQNLELFSRSCCTHFKHRHWFKCSRRSLSHFWDRLGNGHYALHFKWNERWNFRVCFGQFVGFVDTFWQR